MFGQVLKVRKNLSSAVINLEDSATTLATNLIESDRVSTFPAAACPTKMVIRIGGSLIRVKLVG